MMDKNSNDKKIKWYNKLLIGLFFVVLSPLIAFGFLIFFILYIVPAPIEYLCYKRSAFCSDFKSKYSLGIWQRQDYNMYNLIKKHNIDLKFHHDEAISWSYIESENFFLIFEWFEVLQYDEVDGQWMIAETDNDELEKLTESLNKVVTENIPEVLKPTKIIISDRAFCKQDYKKAKDDELFFIIENQKDLIKKLIALQ